MDWKKDYNWADLNRYSFPRFKEAAMEDPTPENIANLAAWFEWYSGDMFWNGECYFDEDFELYPIYDDDNEIIGWELK